MMFNKMIAGMLFVLFSLASPSTVYANDRAFIEAQVEAAAAAARVKAMAVEVTPDYVDVAERVGKALSTALVTAARNLGVEVNTFAQSPVGFTILMLVIWHFFGQGVLQLSIGLLIMFVGAKIGYRVWQQGKTTSHTVSYVINSDGSYKRDKDGEKVAKSETTSHNFDSSYHASGVIIASIGCVAGIIIIFV